MSVTILEAFENALYNVQNIIKNPTLVSMLPMVESQLKNGISAIAEEDFVHRKLDDIFTKEPTDE